ncbi:MAG: YfcE family phosphodiesterase [Treponema sp.]|nr:YfcE family phosphodiesterase [Treponema sp.]
MNTLTICGTNLIGSVDALKGLNLKTRSKILVVSDTHGNNDVFEDVILTYGTDCDALVFCGDGICDLESYVRNAKTEPVLKNALPEIVAFARGNGDPAVSRFLETQIMPSTQFNICGKKVIVIHGHQVSVEYNLHGLINWAQSKGADMVCFGHTHVPEKIQMGNVFCVNPGSCSRPRSDTDPTIATITVYKEKRDCKVQFFSLSF